MLKEIILLVIGGVVTYVVTAAFHRSSKRSPKMTWRLLPAVRLESQSLTAFNIIISNKGNQAATNVETVVELPTTADIVSFEVEPSDVSLNFTVKRGTKSEKNRVAVTFTRFQTGVDCVLSLLTRKTSPEHVAIGLTGDDNVVGCKSEGLSLERAEKSQQRHLNITYGLIAVSVFMTIGIVAWGTNTLAQREFAWRAMNIGDLRYQLGDFQGALESYSPVTGNVYTPSIPSQTFRMARAYAQLTNEVSSVVCLNDLIRRNEIEIAAFALKDPAFDKIRQSKEFIEFSQRLAQRQTAK